MGRHLNHTTVEVVVGAVTPSLGGSIPGTTPVLSKPVHTYVVRDATCTPTIPLMC